VSDRVNQGLTYTAPPGAGLATSQPRATPSLDVGRRSGVLLHPTSLPNRWGIGDLGSEAYAFMDALQDTNQQLWQILPLGPPASAGSPYSTLSAIAGNPLLISLDLLVRDGLLEAEDPQDVAASSPVDFDQVAAAKMPRLRRAFESFLSVGSAQDSFRSFCDEQSDWLDDYALFMALKDAQGGKVWYRWPVPLATRRGDALQRARRELADEIAFHQFTQYAFYTQWSTLRAYGHERGIQIVGDIPIYVAHDSVDVWVHSRNFAIDQTTGQMLQIGGVPPDCFSETGQLWDVPVYDWQHLEDTRFAWWIDRFRKLSQLVDVVRIDHFRGFAAYWQVPQGARTAVDGQWVEAPGAALFKTLQEELADLPIWAEDLGLITRDVEELRDELGLPGMKVLQFAFDDRGAANPYLPFNYDRNCVCYTGTHDNDTTRGWWAQLDDKLKPRVADYLGVTSDDEVPWSLVRLAISSVANDVIIPWQDVLELGTEARLNVPGTPTGNWTWRFKSRAITSEVMERFAQVTVMYGRSALAEKDATSALETRDDLRIECHLMDETS
jgi:4-alpha-glucanotransferase